MPIEIRELVIKATVSDNQQQEGTSSAAGSTTDSSTAAEQQKVEITEQVLNILKRQQER